jgi:hypothetical protein
VQGWNRGNETDEKLTIVADPARRLLISEQNMIVMWPKAKTKGSQSPIAVEALTMLKMSVG